MTKTVAQFNSKQTCALFGISNMTLLAWRKGTKSRTALPVAAPKKGETKPVVRYNVSQLLAWAKKHAVEIVKAPEAIAAGTSDEAGKPGPKPRVALVKEPAKPAAKKVAAKKHADSLANAMSVSKAAVKKAVANKAKPVAKKASPLKGTKVAAKSVATSQVQPA